MQIDLQLDTQKTFLCPHNQHLIDLLKISPLLISKGHFTMHLEAIMDIFRTTSDLDFTLYKKCSHLFSCWPSYTYEYCAHGWWVTYKSLLFCAYNYNQEEWRRNSWKPGLYSNSGHSIVKTYWLGPSNEVVYQQ